MGETVIRRTAETVNGTAFQEQTERTDATSAMDAEEWAAHVIRVKAARGKYVYMFSSSEERTDRKQEEISREDARWGEERGSAA